MKIVVFEDEGYKNLHPLTLFRPAFELRCGFTTLLEKIARKFPEYPFLLFTRDYLIPTLKKRWAYSINKLEELKEDDILFLNGRVLVDKNFSLEPEGEEISGRKGNQVVYLRAKKETTRKIQYSSLAELIEKLSSLLPSREVEDTLINYPWDLINLNGEAIEDDFQHVGGKILGSLSSQASIIGDKGKVFIGKGAIVHPFVALDVREGPIIIDEEVEIYPGSHIQGPTAIGKKSHIVGAKVREGCSFGPVSMIGGEVEESIFQGYANKFHEGFLGHAYIGEWVNLGALCTNSDLKNTYGPVKVYINGEMMNSGELKVGSFVGDHAKLGIGTLLNTGTVIGAGSNVFGGEMPPKFVPSFSWGSGKEFVEFRLEKALATARVVMSRRDVVMSEEDAELIKKVFELTQAEREKFGVRR